MKDIKEQINERIQLIDQELESLMQEKNNLLKYLQELDAKIIFARGKRTELVAFLNSIELEESKQQESNNKSE